MSACLVQAHGTSILELPSGYFKNFPRILEEFRTLVREATSSSDFLIKDINDPSSHREKLLECVMPFRRLASIRAGGLHAGRGLTREATIYSANLVSDFLECLALSSRIKPYLSFTPRCLLYNKERTIIIEDLARRLADVTEKDKDTLLVSMYLVLPDIPENEPEWMEAFDRVTISPKNRDVSYLLQVLETAVPTSLRRTSRSGEGFSVVVRPDDPHALSIAPQYLRRQFNDLKDRWYADIGTANGRLEKGNYLDLPPQETVRKAFEINLEESGLLNDNLRFTANESWPFIVSSLDFPGTTGPYWFLIRHTDDLNQLIAQLNRAKRIGRDKLSVRVELVITGIEAIQKNEPLKQSDPYFMQIINNIENADKKRESLTNNLERHRNTHRELPNTAVALLEKIVEGQSISHLYEHLEEIGFSLPGLHHWSRVLAEIACDYEDIPALNKTLAYKEFKSAHTAARKAIQAIDFRLYGPPIENIV